MKKDELIEDIKATFEKFSGELEVAGITAVQFYKWIDSARTYDQVRKCNTFVHGGKSIFTRTCLLRSLIVTQTIYKIFPPEQWRRLRSLTNNHKQVQDLRICIVELKKVWLSRPKFKVTKSR